MGLLSKSEGAERIVDVSQLLAECQEALYARIVVLMGGRVKGVRDVLQETDVYILRNAGNFNPAKGKFLAWAMKMAEIQVKKFRSRAQREGSRVLYSQEAFDAVIASLERQDSIDEPELSIAALRVCLKTLENTELSLLKDLYLRGHRLNSLAEKTGVSANTLSQQVCRLRKRLHSCIVKRICERDGIPDSPLPSFEEMVASEEICGRLAGDPQACVLWTEQLAIDTLLALYACKKRQSFDRARRRLLRSVAALALLAGTAWGGVKLFDTKPFTGETKMNREGIVVIAAVASLAVNARELVWVGDNGSAWETAENWRIAGSQERATWQTGDAVLFDDDAKSYSITFTPPLEPAAVVFSNTVDYVLTGGTAAEPGISGAATFDKYLSGTVEISGLHSYTGDANLWGGKVYCTADNDQNNAEFSGIGNPRAERKVNIWTNAVLELASYGATGAGTSSQRVQMELNVEGGTLKTSGSVTAADKANKNCVTFGNTSFKDGTLEWIIGNANWKSCVFYGDWLKFLKGESSTPYTWSGGSNGYGLMFGKSGATEIYVEDITGDDASDVIWKTPIGREIRWTGSGNVTYGLGGPWKKTGTGTLELGTDSHLSNFTGDVQVVEGTLKLTGREVTVSEVDRGTLGSRLYPHTVTVLPGATLWFAVSDVLGQAYNGIQETTLHIKGGTLKQTQYAVNGFGKVILEDATLDYQGKNGSWPTFLFNDTLTIKGTKPLTMPQISSSTLAFGTSYKGMSDICVEDITGDSNVDATIEMAIHTGGTWSSYENIHSTFRKTGAGTLLLNNTGSTFTGSVAVAEGTLQIKARGNSENPTYTAIGSMMAPDKTVTVSGSGVLYFDDNDAIGQLNAPLTTAFVLENGGTLKLASGKCTGIGPLTIRDGVLDYSGRNGSVWGTFAFHGRVTIDSETGTPFTFTANNNALFSLGYSDGKTIDGTVYYGKTVFDVKDITGDGRADAIVEVPMKDLPTWNNATLYKGITYSTGLAKEGAGTLRIASQCSYTYGTDVREGTLLVDGKVPGTTTVSSGAFIGGSGEVASVILEDGAGLEVDASQSTPLYIASLTVKGKVNIRVTNAQNVAKNTINAPIATIASLTGSLGNVQPALEGDSGTSLLKLKQSGNTISAVYSNGTVIMLLGGN